MKKIERSQFKLDDKVVIACMNAYIWKKCKHGGGFSPMEIGNALNYDPWSLTEAFCQIHPGAKTYEEYTIIQWCALFSLYDDEPILKECFKFLKDFI